MRCRSTLVLLAWCAFAGLAQADTIAWQFKAGDTFYSTETTNMKMEMSFMGQNVPMENSMRVICKFTVKEVKPDGGVVIERRIESQKSEATQQVPGMDMDELNEKMTGATFLITLNSKMEVEKVAGFDDFMKRLVGDNDEMAQMLKMSMNEETIKRTLDELFLFVPGKPVTVGDTWDRSAKIPMGPLGTLKAKTKYKLEGRDGGMDKISHDSDLTFEAPKADDASPMPFKINKADIKVDRAKGVISFDTKRGRMAENRGDVVMTMKMEVEAGGQEIEMTIQQEIKSEFKISDTKPTQ